MGYKQFINNTNLPAEDINAYLMNQSVMVFANASARTAALPTPLEGMVAYLADSNSFTFHDGTAWQIFVPTDSGWVSSVTGWTAATNFSLTTLAWRKEGDLLSFSATFTYTGATITSSANGNIADTTCLTIPSGYRPGGIRTMQYEVSGSSSGNARITAATGVVTLTTLNGTATIVSGNSLWFSDTYLVA